MRARAGSLASGGNLAVYSLVDVSRKITKYARRRVTRKLMRAVPWVGGVLALITLGDAIKRKGFFGGTLHTALDFTPVVGTLKNICEVGRGRDFISDTPPPV